MKKRKSKKEIGKLLNDMGYILLDEYNKNNQRRIVIKDEDNYKYDIQLGDFLNKNNCIAFVHKKNPYSLNNISIWIKKNNKTFELCDKNIYNGSNKKLKFHCLICDDNFYSEWFSIYENRGCAICAGKQIGEKHSFGFLYPELLKEWDNDNLIFPFKIVAGFHKKIKWICHICGYKWNAVVKERTSHDKTGCPACAGKIVTDKNRLSILYPELILEWHSIKNGDLIPYSFSYSNHKKIWWICSKCGFEWKTEIASRTTMKSGCPYCSSSKGNKTIKNFLVKNNIYFTPEYKFDDCRNKKPLPFDFYLPTHNICIEYDGEFHYNKARFRFKDKEKMQSEIFNTQKRDAIKTKYCKNNNIKLIRIPYWNFNNIENILSKELNI